MNKEPLALQFPELNSIQLSKLRAEFKRIDKEARLDELLPIVELGEAGYIQAKDRIVELEKLL